MNKLYIFIFIISILDCSKNTDNANSHMLNFSNLNKIRNKAELLFASGEYCLSLSYYNQLVENDYFLADDLYNGYMSSLKCETGDFKIMYEEKLIQYGVCDNFFSSHNPEFLRNRYNHVTKFAGIDNVLRDSLMIIVDFDQFLRDTPSRHDSIYFYDRINYENFVRLINHRGFPSVGRIGIDCSSSERGFRPNTYEIPLLHFAKNGFDVYEILDTALNLGEMHPYTYASIYDTGKYGQLQEGEYFAENYILSFGRVPYVIKEAEIPLEVVNSRDSIGLYTYEEYKILYRHVIDRIASRESGDNEKFLRLPFSIANLPTSVLSQFPDYKKMELK